MILVKMHQVVVTKNNSLTTLNKKGRHEMSAFFVAAFLRFTTKIWYLYQPTACPCRNHFPDSV